MIKKLTMIMRKMLFFYILNYNEYWHFIFFVIRKYKKITNFYIIVAFLRLNHLGNFFVILH